MTAEFVSLAEEIVDDLLAASPTRAYWAGDHRYDDRLPDFSDDAVRAELQSLAGRAEQLAGVDPAGLTAADDVDRQLLSAEVDRRRFELATFDERSWNPLVHNPGDLIFGLLAREVGDPEQRLEALAARLSGLPTALSTAEQVLGDCPRVHVETAIGQLEGTTALVRDEVPALLGRVPGLRKRVEPARDGALTALARHADFLHALLPKAQRDPRLGRDLWEARLQHTLDSAFTAAAVLESAQGDLERVTEALTEAAAQLTGSPDIGAALATLARDHPDDDTIVAKAGHTLGAATEYVRRLDLVTVLDDPIEIIMMPEYARGVAVAYCDAPGPLETRVVPTFYAISPTPADWSPERVQSFYREYNDHMLRNLTVHEAMPGHYLQLAHARRFRGSSRVRAICQSGSFIEGWAVYVEELMIEHGFGGLPVRIQQLKMQLRMIVNAILDQLVHCAEMSEADAMALMIQRGYQEEGEAAGKWRRALLTSAQLSTYYVGYVETSRIARSRPDGRSEREWHDEMLSHGSPAPRHLARLVGG
ncbi:MAG: DUF885 domain-containing protein [Actinomycetota bacterium]|nr:DUF885 domain-containing protein [Actinomycetota bacterium]